MSTSLATTKAPQTLRDYQLEAVQSVKQAWQKEKESVLAALATGAGKTTILAQLMTEVLNPEHQRGLVIAHTQEIIYQLYDRIAQQYAGRLDQLYTPHFYKGLGIVMGVNDDPNARIVIATRQSLHPQRLKSLLKSGKFDYLFVDEAHHALADNTYGAIVDALKAANPKLKILGLTATPKRTDRKALATIFDDIVYQWLIPDGIDQGYLVPVTRVKVKTKVNLSGINTARGDYSQTKLISALKTANWQELSLQAFRTHISPTGRQCLAFLPSVEMSKNFARQLQADGIKAAHIDGETPKEERQHHLREYTLGKLQVISNMAVLTEGFDAPATSAVFLARPTRSSTLFTQIVGRGLRLHPAKQDCLLIDMTVLDTKALEIGTLLGRLLTCPDCMTDYYAGFKKCPQCGAEPPKAEAKGEANGRGKFKTGTAIGQGIESEYAPLFERAFAAWYADGEGYFSCTLKFEQGALVIVPPLTDNAYRLAYVPREKADGVKFINENEDLGSLMLDADNYLEKLGGHHSILKDAQWRALPPTTAQLELIRKLRIPKPNEMNRGTASQLITHHLAVWRVVEAKYE